MTERKTDPDRLVRRLGNLQLVRDRARSRRGTVEGAEWKVDQLRYQIAQVGDGFEIPLAVWYNRRGGHASLCFIGGRPLGEGIAPMAFWELVKEGQPLADRVAAELLADEEADDDDR